MSVAEHIAPVIKPKIILRDKFTVALLVAFTVFLFRLAIWISRSFGDISLDQMLFHLGSEATTGVPPKLIRSAFLELGFRPLVAFLLAFGIMSIPFLKRLGVHKILFWMSLLGVLITTYFLYDVLKLREYFERSSFTGDWYQVYAKPATLNLAVPENKRNLVFIYVESMEKFRVTPDTQLGKFSDEFGAPKQWYMLPGTQWTLAAMISSQCGVTQMLHGFVGKNNVNKTPNPLKNAVCMADILKSAGYQTLYIDSANPAFAGKGNFFSTHGFAQVHGAANIDAEIPKSQIPDWWGVPDTVLYEYTKRKINSLAAASHPFYVALNTVNTHGPHGVLAPSCEQKGFKNKIDSIFNCSVGEVGEFLSWLHQQPFSSNTVVVIMGDHPMMAPNSIKNKLATSEPEIFFLIRRPDGVKLPAKNMTHVDIFPTTMAALGFELPDEHLAMGHNIYKADSLVDTIAPQELRKIIRKPSPAYDALW